VSVSKHTRTSGHAGKDFERKLSEGTFAPQGRPGAIVRYRNIRVKRL